MDIRQTPLWGDYLSSIGWQTEHLPKCQIFIRPVPFFKTSVIKIQRPQNPPPFEDIDRIARKYKASFVIIEPERESYCPEVFLQNGFRPSLLSLTHTLTIWIDLAKSEKEIFSSFSENARRNIKKALNNNLTVKIVNLEKESLDPYFEDFYTLLQSLMKLKHFYSPSKEEMRKKMLALKNNSVLIFAYSSDQQAPLAVVWGCIHDQNINYVQTGITQKGYQLLANYLLVWELVKYAKIKGIKTYDFEGLYDPRFPKERRRWKNFTEFKKRFHGELIEYPQAWIKIYSPVFKMLYYINLVFNKIGLT